MTTRILEYSNTGATNEIIRYLKVCLECLKLLEDYVSHDIMINWSDVHKRVAYNFDTFNKDVEFSVFLAQLQSLIDNNTLPSKTVINNFLSKYSEAWQKIILKEIQFVKNEIEFTKKKVDEIEFTKKLVDKRQQKLNFRKRFSLFRHVNKNH